MTTFYSASTKGFYVGTVHGERTISVPDPKWVRPLIERVVIEDGAAITQQIPDMDALPPMVTVPNPHCAVPEDAVVISEAKYNELLQAQSTGKVIEPDSEGHPCAVDYVPTAAELQRNVAELARQELLHSDVVFIRCGKAGIAWPATWQHYVVTLRSIAGGDVTASELPARPEYPAGT